MYKKVYFIHFKFGHLILEYVIAFHFLGDLDFNTLTCCSFNDTGVSFFNPSSSRGNTIKRMFFVRCNAVLGFKGHAVWNRIGYTSGYTFMANCGVNVFAHFDLNDKVPHTAMTPDFCNIFGCQRTALDGYILFYFHVTTVEKGGGYTNGYQTKELNLFSCHGCL